MRIRYASRALEKLCTDEQEMVKRRADVADKLKVRVNALYEANDFSDLQKIDPLGRWHALHKDLAGAWAGHLSRNWRLLVKPEGGGPIEETDAATLLGLDDYH
jgi:proteic killer suppression protein